MYYQPSPYPTFRPLPLYMPGGNRKKNKPKYNVICKIPYCNDIGSYYTKYYISPTKSISTPKSQKS